MDGRTRSITLPYPILERAVLSKLAELKPADVVGEEPERESVALTNELVAVENRLLAIQAELTGDSGDVPALARAAKTLDTKRQDLTRQIALARQKEANPRTAAWAEAKSLFDVAADEAIRVRLRGLLRTIISRIWVLIVPVRADRISVIHIDFTGGGHRRYQLFYRRPPAQGKNRAGRLFVQSWAQGPDSGVNASGQPDLSNPEHAARVYSAFARFPQGELDDFAAMADRIPAEPARR
jgi:hypothetical protein